MLSEVYFEEFCNKITNPIDILFVTVIQLALQTAKCQANNNYNSEPSGPYSVNASCFLSTISENVLIMQIRCYATEKH